MDCGQRSPMSSIERVEKDARLCPANFPNNDPVGPVAKSGFEQVGKSDLALMRIELRLGGYDMRFLYKQFRRVFDDQNAVVIGDEPGQHVQQCGLA